MRPFSARDEALALSDKWDLDGNVPDSGPLLDELTAALRRAYYAGLAAGRASAPTATPERVQAFKDAATKARKLAEYSLTGRAALLLLADTLESEARGFGLVLPLTDAEPPASPGEPEDRP